jgi:outer membrane receptor for ferrienterochelin and colicins
VDSNGDDLYYKSFRCCTWGAQYHLTDNISINGRINNLLDEGFTSFRTVFEDFGARVYEPEFIDDYNNKDKVRNFWVGVNVNF